MSAEYIMAGGNSNVILCERGIRTFETYTRNTLDLSAVPVLRRLDPPAAAIWKSICKGESTCAVSASTPRPTTTC